MELILGTTPSWSLLIIRGFLGIIFFAHGAQLVFGWFEGQGLRATIHYFWEALHVPAPLAMLAAVTQCFGGLAVFMGFLVRPAALGLIVVMLVPIAKVHARHGFFLNWALEPDKGHGIEMNVALIGMALALCIGRAGAVSIDPLLIP